MKIAIIGSRDFKDYKLLEKILSVETDISCIISGGAKGADTLGVKYAMEHSIPYKVFLADWKDLSFPDAVIKETIKGVKYDAKAGIRRNKQIIENCDKVIAFWDGTSPGTFDSLQKAKKLNKEIKIVKYLLI